MNKRFFKSLGELVVLTYGVTFFGLVSATGFDVLDLAAWKAAATAAFPAVLVAVYGALAKLVGNRDSALAVDTRRDLTQ